MKDRLVLEVIVPYVDEDLVRGVDGADYLNLIGSIRIGPNQTLNCNITVSTPCGQGAEVLKLMMKQNGY